MTKKKRIKRQPRKRRNVNRSVSLKPIPLNGDHGTQTEAATAGTIVVKLDGPNNMGQRRRIDALDTIIARDILTLPQQQAAQAIRDAYARKDALSSGGPLKEWVQSSPRPDAAVAAQVDANSWWAHVVKPLSRDQRDLVRHVCGYGLPLRTAPNPRRASERFKVALDAVALHLKYAHPLDVVDGVALMQKSG